MFIACRALEFSFSFSRLIYWFSPDAISRPTKTVDFSVRGNNVVLSGRIIPFGRKKNHKILCNFVSLLAVQMCIAFNETRR
jgi:hypothetical protein